METIQRTLKVRIYPIQNQQEFLDKTLGCCRFLYNQMLAERIQKYNEYKEDKTKLYGLKDYTMEQFNDCWMEDFLLENNYDGYAEFGNIRKDNRWGDEFNTWSDIFRNKFSEFTEANNFALIKKALKNFNIIRRA